MVKWDLTQEVAHNLEGFSSFPGEFKVGSKGKTAGVCHRFLLSFPDCAIPLRGAENNAKALETLQPHWAIPSCPFVQEAPMKWPLRYSVVRRVLVLPLNHYGELAELLRFSEPWFLCLSRRILAFGLQDCSREWGCIFMGCITHT